MTVQGKRGHSLRNTLLLAALAGLAGVVGIERTGGKLRRVADDSLWYC